MTERRKVLALIPLGAVLMLTSCGIVRFFPSDPGPPFSLMLRDNDVWFHWCGSEVHDIRSVEISYHPRNGQAGPSGKIAYGTGAATLKKDEEFSGRHPLSGIEYSQSSALPVDTSDQVFYVTTTLGSESRPGPWGSFLSRKVADTPNKWLRADGTVSESPCSSTESR